MSLTKETAIKVTDALHGPFIIIVTDPQRPDDKDLPLVVGPPGGYPDTATAFRYIEESFANRRTPYLDLRFEIVPLRTQADFNRFCSWTD